MEKELQKLIDRNEIIDRVNGIVTNADWRNWKGIIDCFADEVVLDYTSLWGGSPTKLKAAEIIDSWKGLPLGLKMTQHTITGHEVKIREENNEADCFSSIMGFHYLPNETGNDTWIVRGFYDHHLVKTANGWKIDRMKLTVTLIEGNTEIPRLAQQKVKAIR
jgi:SnoaL-like domain